MNSIGDQQAELSSHTDDELVDLRSLEYVSEYDDHLMCPICHCPFIHPVRLRCDHIFCQKCLDSAITSFGPNSEVAFTCPSCRAPTRDAITTVPRLLINMCDDITVKCPYSREGCREVLPRANVQSHVDKYCGYRLLKCPGPSCDKKTRRKNFRPAECVHELRRCSLCEEEVMDQDYDEHTTELCPTLETVCSDCQITVTRRDFSEHVRDCPEAIRPCSASKYCCPVKLKRAELAQHEERCPLIAIGPYFEAQNSRLDSMELTIRHLRQRNEILEDGLASIKSTLVEGSRAAVSRRGGPSSTSPSTISITDPPSTSISSPHADPFSLSPEVPTHRPDSTRGSSSGSYTNATTYLLYLHESLREEVTQLSQALTDLDARASMAIMNECLRIKEDMAHTNAAVTSVRMQVQWLMNPRLHHGQQQQQQQQQRAATIRANADQGPSRSVVSGADAMGSTAAGPSDYSSTGSMGQGSLPIRRLSDGGREGTKL